MQLPVLTLYYHPICHVSLSAFSDVSFVVFFVHVYLVLLVAKASPNLDSVDHSLPELGSRELANNIYLIFFLYNLKCCFSLIYGLHQDFLFHYYLYLSHFKQFLFIIFKLKSEFQYALQFWIVSFLDCNARTHIRSLLLRLWRGETSAATLIAHQLENTKFGNEK